MFNEFKWFAEQAVSIFKSVSENRKRNWSQIAELFEEIAKTLEGIATKFKDRKVPREEFVAIQIYAEALEAFSWSLFDEDQEEQRIRWSELLGETIVSVDGSDSALFGFKSVPGPFYNRKEGYVEPPRSYPEEIPEVMEILDAASAFRSAAKVFQLKAK